MIEVPDVNGVRIAVFGLGRSGLATARALAASGAEVMAWDDDEGARQRAVEAGIPLVDLYGADWQGVTSLVLSPGIPHTYPQPHAIADKARGTGTAIIGDIELLGRARPDAAYIGITGTNGKSTTTALIAHILKTAGRTAEVGGNVGTPALDLEPLDADGVYVLEMSSYQLELTRSITFDVAVLLNISADHLDRHGGMDGYVAAKRWIFWGQEPRHTAVVSIDDEHCRDFFQGFTDMGDRRTVPVSVLEAPPGGVYVEGGRLIDDMDGGNLSVCDLAAVASLPGAHNWQNAAAAFAACRAVGVTHQEIVNGLTSFPGLAHRQEPIAVIDDVSFVNDSKATNAEAAARALACYRDIYWIAGGRAKGEGLDAIEPQMGAIRHAFLIGEAARDFAGALEGRVPTTVAGELRQALDQAYAMAREDGTPDAVVLLSPACASFDQFDNFEVRGDSFRALVQALPGKHRDAVQRVAGGEEEAA